MAARPSKPTDPRQFQAEWRLIFAAGELLWLVAFAGIEQLVLRPLARNGPIGRSALGYALLQAAVLSAGYLAMRLGLSAAYGHAARRLDRPARAALPPPGELMDDFDPRRLARTALWVSAMLLCMAFFSGVAWVLVALPLLGVLQALEYSIDRDSRLHGAVPLTDAEIAAAGGLADAVQLARARGHGELELLGFDAGAGEPPAAAIPGTGRPRICLDHGAMARFTPAELTAVIAHELAHHELHHPRKTLRVEAGSRLAVAALLCVLLSVAGRAGLALHVARLLPTALLGWYLLRTGGLLVERAARRHRERQAHRRAVAITGDAAAYRSVLARLVPDVPPPVWPQTLLSEAPCRQEVEHLIDATEEPPRGKR